MPTLKLELDQETYEALITVALREWRPTVWEAARLLRRAIHQEQHHSPSDPCPTCARPHHEHEATAAEISMSQTRSALTKQRRRHADARSAGEKAETDNAG